MQPTKPTILVVDDKADVRDTLQLCLQYEGFIVTTAVNGASALDAIERGPVDLVLLDVKMPGMDGIEVLGRILAIKPALPIVMMSGHGDIKTAVDAVKKGAEDFLEKPLDTDRLVVVIRNALRRGSLENANKNLREQVDAGLRWIGASEASLKLIDLADRAARSNERILIVGESGTGKERLARRIHAASPRRDGPFEVLACGAIPEELFEDEIFGHLQGAFSGAISRRQGVFERAAGGTLLLDEIGELSSDAQAKLLRVLETGMVRPLGGETPVRTDVRIVATTHRDLRAWVQSGRFREDLYFRLSVVILNISPLRERTADIMPLALEFLTEAARRLRRPAKKLTSNAAGVLRSRGWRGNARELRNVMDALALTVDGASIDAEHVQNYFSAADAQDSKDPFEAPTLEEFRNLADRIYLERKIDAMGGNLKRTAEVLNISRSNLYKTLERVGLKPPPGATQTPEAGSTDAPEE